MIEFINIEKSEPYNKFTEIYKKAKKSKQKAINALNISSYDTKSLEVESRYVNLKYITDDQWIFFSNYSSPKALQFIEHPQISAILFWESINTQIRIKATIEKSSKSISDKHFAKRDKTKNALSISSFQSSVAISYEDILESYNKSLSKLNDKTRRPDYWGGYSFVPYYFEFWEGHKSRLNKREIYIKSGGIWNYSILQP
jgi:pyridoxamine 5'-phosphate oxidase